MSTGLQRNDEAKAPVRGLIPPYLVLRDFLDEATVAALLDYALSREFDFTPTRLGSNAIDPSFRVSTGLRDLGDYREILKAKILSVLPSLIAQLQINPLDSPKLETQLVAHGDGAFYKRHIDTRTSDHEDINQIRILSGVYYFNVEPKAFTGGALRLYAIGNNGEEFIDIAPVRNSLLVFPSWAPHEVRPVNCPSKRFIDSRFAINCWLLCKKPGAA